MGVVTEIDHYGNLITNVPAQALTAAPRDERMRISLDEHCTFGLWRTYGEHPAGHAGRFDRLGWDGGTGDREWIGGRYAERPCWVRS